MNFVKWNENMVTGIEIVDQQHKELIEMINAIAPVLASSGNGPVDEMKSICDQLMAYAALHFRTEEDLMVTVGVDPRVLTHHRQSHSGFEQKVTAWQDRIARDNRIAGSELLPFLAGWLLHHILGEDQTMSRQIRAINSGMEPDRAYREAGGYRTYPSETALTEIFISLYMQLIERQGGRMKNDV
jgi:hemerythrin